MRRLFLLFGCIVLVTLVSWMVLGTSWAREIGILDLYEGTVTVHSGPDIKEGKTGDRIFEDDVLSVPVGSRAGVMLRDGSIIRLEGGTDASVKSLLRDGSIHTKVELQSGTVWANVVTDRGVPSFAVETPTIVATVRGTWFSVTCDAMRCIVKVRKGKVGVRPLTGSGTEVLVDGGQTLTVDNPVDCDDETSDNTKEKDPWIDLNENLDGAGGTGETASVSSALPSSAAASSPKPSTTVDAVGAPPTSSIAASSVATSRPATTMPPTFSARPSSSVASSRAATGGGGTTTQGGDTGGTTGQTSSETRIDRTKVLDTAPKPPALISLRVQCTKIPLSGSNIQGGPVPTMAQCALTAFYDDKSSKTIPPSDATWAVKGTAQGNISSDGGYVTVAQRGADTVTATYQGISAETTIDVP